MRWRGALPVAAISLLLGFGASAQAASLQEIGTFSQPVFVTSEPSDPNRVLVVEKGGTVILREGGTSTTWLDLPPIATTGEQGLLSIAFAPDYETSGHFYAFYNASSSLIRISEFTADVTPPLDPAVNPATERIVLTIPNSDTAPNHNAGQLQIGPDDNLYISTGDGGDTPETAQDETSLLGKILRIDPDPSGGDDYTIPPGNPFAGVGDPGADEIWSLGLRNPFRFSFDRTTGDMLIGDVGQALREEVDYLPAGTPGGVNFGWDCREGSGVHNGACANDPGFTGPIHEYLHTVGNNCSITGGYVVRDPALPELAGRYVYADFCQGEIRSLVPGLPAASGDRFEGLTVQNPSSFGEDAAGRLYVASLGGDVFRLVPGDPPPGGGDPGGGDPGGGDPPPGTDPDPMASDGDPPAVELSARGRQRLGEDGDLVCRVSADEDSEAVVRLALLDGRRVALRLEEKSVELDAGERARVRFRLDRPDRRALRAADGKLDARFRARATDASGNRSPLAEAFSKVG